jgi:hypothetical protein
MELMTRAEIDALAKSVSKTTANEVEMRVEERVGERVTKFWESAREAVKAEETAKAEQVKAEAAVAAARAELRTLLEQAQPLRVEVPELERRAEEAKARCQRHTQHIEEFDRKIAALRT